MDDRCDTFSLTQNCGLPEFGGLNGRCEVDQSGADFCASRTEANELIGSIRQNHFDGLMQQVERDATDSRITSSPSPDGAK